MKVTCKQGVRFDVVTADLVRMLDALVSLAVRPEVPSEGIVITAGSNGQHMAGSKHYIGQAIDVRSKTFRGAEKQAFAEALRRRLGERFTVLLESEGLPQEHFHLQVRKGLT